MFIEKKPNAAVESKKAKVVAERESPVESTRKKDLQGLAFDDQSRRLSARQPADSTRLPQGEASYGAEPLGEVRRIFREADLPDRLVPTNLVAFTHDPGSGALTMTLRSSFTRKFNDQNTIRFEQVISGILRPGSFSGIRGIRRGMAEIDAMSRARSGVVSIHGRLGPVGKSVEFQDDTLPSLP